MIKMSQKYRDLSELIINVIFCPFHLINFSRLTQKALRSSTETRPSLENLTKNDFVFCLFEQEIEQNIFDFSLFSRFLFDQDKNQCQSQDTSEFEQNQGEKFVQFNWKHLLRGVYFREG